MTASFHLNADDGSSVPKANVISESNKKLAYIVSDSRIPFWSIMGRGIQKSAESLGYTLDIYSANNHPKSELEFVIRAIRDEVKGIVISPTSSSAATTILKLASAANIPVVISDIGTEKGEYAAYISSDNKQGARDIGMILVKEMKARGWNEGKVGIIAVPQTRANGRARTAGFMEVMSETGTKVAGISQQETFSYQESYDFTQSFIEEHPNLRAILTQGSDRYSASLNAIRDAGKQDAILLICFDAEPEFLDLIPRGIIIASAMQQPYLMGQKAIEEMNKYLHGEKVQKNIQLPTLAISAKNIKEKLPLIRVNVLGMEPTSSDSKK